MPEPATASAAVQTGAIDWLEAPPPDLLPPFRRDRNLGFHDLGMLAGNDPRAWSGSTISAPPP